MERRKQISNHKNLSPGYIELPLVLLVLFADQISKYLAAANLPWRQKVDFIPGFISFVYTTNTGAAFSILTDQRWFLVTVSSAVILGMVFLRQRLTESKRVLRVAWALIFAGAFGNLCDRIISGSVVDFLSFDFANFPVFNIADIAITSGGVLYLLAIFWLEWAQEKNHA